ncbi:MAG: pitrilysin family protein [Xanthobacteraceae bacterium]
MAASPCSAEIASAAGAAGFTLDNGLQVVVIPDHRTPVVTHMIWYRIGAADEPPGKSGIAHFLEHLMFKGTARNPAGRFSKTLATIGGQENAFTSSDYTSYFQRVTPQNLATVMDFEADRMTGLILSEDNVASERKVVLEEWNMVSGNVPAARLGEQIAAALYLNHPYGKPVIGWHHEIEQLNREDALAFYRRFYTPNNAVLVVAGDVTPAEVRALAEQTYGKVAPRAEIGPRLRPQEPDPSAIRHVTLADPRVAQPTLQRAYLVPSLAAGKPGEAAALEVLAQILGGGATGRLYRALIVDQELASDAGSWYQGLALDATRFGVFATPRPGVELAQLEDALDGVVAAVADKGVAPEEVARAKTRMIADYVYAQDNQAAMARMYGSALTTGLTLDDVLARPDRLRAVTADQVQDVARRFLDKRRSVTGYLVKDAGRREDKEKRS